MSADANLKIIQFVRHHIDQIEKKVLSVARLKDDYANLLAIPGVGTILALTIMLETGHIHRFKKGGNYSSYCRFASSKRISDNKSKGKGNTKNGNQYLVWAFIEAANLARRYNEPLNAYFQRRAAKTYLCSGGIFMLIDRSLLMGGPNPSAIHYLIIICL